MRILPIAVAIAVMLDVSVGLDAQNGAGVPRVELRSAPLLELPGEVDSNSPAVWDLVGGRNLLFVMTSMSGQPRRAWGRDLTSLGGARQVELESPDGGIWMEAILQDADGTWYGYFHNEVPATMCRGTTKVLPRIGAARSHDRGATWELLGVILEAPPRTYDCTTENTYFVGGVGRLQRPARSRLAGRVFLLLSVPAIAGRAGGRRRPSRVGRPRCPQRQDHDLAQRRMDSRDGFRAARRAAMVLSVGVAYLPGR